jgi:hypothetical protein
MLKLQLSFGSLARLIVLFMVQSSRAQVASGLKLGLVCGGLEPAATVAAYPNRCKNKALYFRALFI